MIHHCVFSLFFKYIIQICIKNNNLIVENLMNRYESSAISAEQTLYEVQSLLNRVDEIDEETEKNETLQIAFARTHEFVKKKQVWSVYLQRLMYVFFDLAFNINKHFAIKDALKNYRSITQSQHSESLKNVLEEYRDKKLESILVDQISEEDIKIIVQLPDIQNDGDSSEIIMSSFKPQNRESRQSLKSKLKIVWEGYKSIVDTVKVNQKLEGVYLATLTKVFDFVDRFNRKHEFQSFCRNLRGGLQNAFNKRNILQQQKGIYIDLEKADVNTRNIDIRMQQFKVTTKLGLWRESFEVLEDINNLMQIRKGVVKNSVKCLYYENLAMLFKKSNYWHYHAFAYYCYYERLITNPKITQNQKQKASDKLLLSIMCIPPSTLQSRQNRSSQEKISGMLVASTKIPTKDQLCELMISKGITENASENIRQLWNFMFLEFDLSSLSRGLELLQKTEENEFKSLLQSNLIYKQLISVAEVYRKIKLESLLALIPLSRQKILSILLKSHEQRIIDFSLDQKQGIVVFQQRDQSSNPYDEFYEVFTEVALAKQKARQANTDFITKKARQYIEGAEQYFWKIRQYKIKEFKTYLKKPRQELQKGIRDQAKALAQQKIRVQMQRLGKQSEAKLLAQQKQKELVAKKITVEQIIKVKQKRVVRMNDKKVENLTDQDLASIPLQTLNEYLQITKKKVTTDNENKMKKIFTKIDYQERQRREILKQQLQKKIINPENEQNEYKKIQNTAFSDFKEREQIKEKLTVVASELKPKISKKLEEMQENYTKAYAAYKKRLTEEFKQKVLNKARQVIADIKKQKQDDQQRRKNNTQQEDEGGMWAFRSVIKNQFADLKPGAARQFRRDANNSGLGDLKIGGAKKEEDNPSAELRTGNKYRNDKSSLGDLKIGGLSKESNRFQAFNQQQLATDKKPAKTKEEEGSWFGAKKKQEPQKIENKQEDGFGIKIGGGFKAAPPDQTAQLKKATGTQQHKVTKKELGRKFI